MKSSYLKMWKITIIASNNFEMLCVFLNAYLEVNSHPNVWQTLKVFLILAFINNKIVFILISYMMNQFCEIGYYHYAHLVQVF